jgi:hypothetical protein
MNNLADKKRYDQSEQQEKGARQDTMRDEIRRTTQVATSRHNGSFVTQLLPRQGMPLFNHSSPDHLTNSRVIISITLFVLGDTNYSKRHITIFM